MGEGASTSPPRIIGRYALFDELAAGGMATVHVGRLVGSIGFSRTVAVKRMHAQFARDPGFVAMFVDEARLAARIHHPNVVSALDVVALPDGLFLVMEYVDGVTLSQLVRAVQELGERVPPRIAAGILVGALSGLHAAHEAKSETGVPLGLIHRDVSPQNILLGADGVARVLDFGIAKAEGRAHATASGEVKGKIAYMAPEQLLSNVTSRQTDVYAATVVLWELLVGRKLFTGDTVGAVVGQALAGDVPRPSEHAEGVGPELDAIVARGASIVPEQRFATAAEMAAAIERDVPVASASETSAWVRRVAAAELARRAAIVARVERLTATAVPSLADPARDDTHPARAPREDPTLATTSVTAEPGRPAFASVRGGILIALAAAVVAAAVVYVAMRRTAPDVSRADVVPSSAPAARPADAPTPAEPVPSAGTAPLPVASAIVSAAPQAAAAGRPAGPAPVVKPRAKPASCNPPYYVDADGVRTPKRECL